MGRFRLEQSTCAICMESLFDRRDDLDVVYETAMPDCGHVFHEECLQEWFKTQAASYIALQREHYARSVSPSDSEAPAECPTCRKECFADPETGLPGIHRLYLNFDDAAGAGSSSAYQGSSPVRPAGGGREGGKGKGKERERQGNGAISARAEQEALGLARRARGLAEEVREYDERSSEENVEGSIRRAEGLAADMVSQKAVDGMRKYVGGLTTALYNLRATLETSPLLETQQERYRALESTNTALRSEMREATKRLPMVVRQAVEAERAEGEKRVRKAREQCEVLRREYEKEQVLRRKGKQEMAERLEEAARKVKEAEVVGQDKTDAAVSSQGEYLEARGMPEMELTNQAESRTQLKNDLEALQAENAQLKSDLAASSPARTVRTIPRTAHTSGKQLRDAPADSSIEEISFRTYQKGQAGRSVFDDIERDDESRAGPSRSVRHGTSDAKAAPGMMQVDSDGSGAEESGELEIDYPSFADTSLRPVPRPGPGSDDNANGSRSGEINPPRNFGRSHPTTRTISSDAFSNDLGQPKKRSRSKYFDDIPAGRGVAERDADRRTLGGTTSRTNPFSSTRAETDRKKALPPAVPPRGTTTEAIDLTGSPPSASRPNGYTASKPASGLGTGSSVRPLQPSVENGGDRLMALPALAQRVRAEMAMQKEKQRQKSVVEMLGMADKNGRPVKGAVSGTKVKRRA